MLNTLLFRRIGVLLLLLANSSLATYAQREASHWAFGGFGGVDFTCSTPQLTATPFDGLEGGATISSASGELLMITNGDVVWDRDFHVMPHGRGLGGACPGFGSTSSSSQSALIVPHPGKASTYYIFTTDCAEDLFAGGLRYSVVDMSLNGGKGDVIMSNVSLRANTAEKIAAVLKPNGRDLWVVTHGINNNEFYAFSVNSSGINPTPVVSAVGQMHPGGRGYLKFSPDGRRLAANCFQYTESDGIQTELFTFDIATGSVTADFILPTGHANYSASFSPNGKILYTSCAWACSNGYVEQFNLDAGTPQQIVDQRYTIEALTFGGLQLGIDGRLYCLTSKAWDEDYLGMITKPNEVGAACAAAPYYIRLNCGMNAAYGLPNFIESYFQTPVTLPVACQPVREDLIETFDFKATANCITHEVRFDNLSTVFDTGDGLSQPIFYWIFDFGDGEQYSSDLSSVVHVYKAPGRYNVTLSVFSYYAFCPLRTLTYAVDITPPLSPGFTATQECGSLQMNFANTTSAPDTTAWQWKFGDNSPDNAQEKNPSHRYDTAGTYTVSLAPKGCDWIAYKMPVTVYNPLPKGPHIGNDTLLCKTDTVKLKVANSIQGDFLWSDNSTERYLNVVTAGKYWMQLTQGNCISGDTVNIDIYDCTVCDVFIPNVITPNNDEKNDSFRVGVACNHYGFRMDIYNRWGSKLYSTESPSWDGSVDGEQLSVGTYYYIVQYSFMGPHSRVITERKKGWLSVLR